MLKIFISHSWESDAKEYDFLCNVLNRSFKNEWYNLSIPRESPYRIWKEGRSAWEAKKEILEKREQILTNNLESCMKRLESIRKDIGFFRSKEYLGNTIDGVERRFKEYKEKYPYGGKEVEQMRVKVNNRISEIKSGKVEYYINKIKELESEYKSCSSLDQKLEEELKSNFKELRNNFGATFEDWVATEKSRYFKLQDRFKREIAKHGSITMTTKAYPQNLSGEISNRIIESDIVIVIAGLYSYYRQWLDYELRIASDYDKPIISLLPFDQVKIPKEITALKLDIVKFNEDSLIKTILSKQNSMRINPEEKS